MEATSGSQPTFDPVILKGVIADIKGDIKAIDDTLDFYKSQSTELLKERAAKSVTLGVLQERLDEIS